MRVCFTKYKCDWCDAEYDMPYLNGKSYSGNPKSWLDASISYKSQRLNFAVCCFDCLHKFIDSIAKKDKHNKFTKGEKVT